MKKIGIVIPTYKEAENIENLVIKIKDVLKDTNIFTRILVVDDNSPDGTGKIVDNLKSKVNSSNFLLDCLHRDKKEGLGKAYIAGMDNQLEYGVNFIQQMDGDFSHKPEYLIDLINSINDNDLVIGSRYVKGGGVENWSLMRRFLSRFGNMYSRFILGIPVNDLTGGFNLYRREVLEHIGLDNVKSEGYGFIMELKYKTFKLGKRIKEIPIIFPDRIKGHSKIPKKTIYETLILVIKLRLGKI